MPVAYRLLEVLCKANQCGIIAASNQQVEMIGHETICVDVESMTYRACREAFEARSD